MATASRALADTRTNDSMATMAYTKRLMQGIHIGRRLVWLGDKEPAEAESQELWECFSYEGPDTRTEISGNLERFVKAHPSSPWRPAIELSLGSSYMKAGYFSEALDKWEAIWNETKGLTDRKGRLMADSALVDRLKLLSSLGRSKQMKDLFEETKDRQISMAVRPRLDQVRLGYQHMIHHPEDSYRCGTLALDAVTKALYGTNNYWGLIRQKSPETGFSLASLEALAVSNHLGLMAVERTSGTNLVTPSVVHWKEDHYAAIIKQKEGMYEVIDPTFQLDRWLTAAAINREASGQFLVPTKQVPTGWRTLSSDESSQIFGKGISFDWPKFPGCPCNGKCPNCPPGTGGTGGTGGNGGSGPVAQGDSKLGSGGVGGGSYCKSCGKQNINVGGMPSWEVVEPEINLWIEDEPLAYQTATGGRLSFKIYYNQQDPYNPFDPNNEYNLASPMGFWGCSWFSYIDSPGDFTATLYSPGGGQVSLGNIYSPSPQFYSNDRLVTLTNSDGSISAFELFHPNGAVDIYSVQDTNLLDYDVEFLLTQQVNEHGRTTTFFYDSTTFLLTNVVDADGKTNTITYTTSDGASVISQIQDPYGNSVTFTYDNEENLTNITDVGGISTGVAYNLTSYTDPSYGITNMTTPYGSTGFQCGVAGSDYLGYGFLYLYSIVTEPNSDREMFLYPGDDGGDSISDVFTDLPQVYTDTSNVPTNRPVDNAAGTNTLDNPDWNNSSANDYMNIDNSFYWNAQQFANLSPAFLSSLASGITDETFDLVTNSDYANARLRHYNQYNLDGFIPQGLTLSMERQPSPDGITPGKMLWYDYPNKPAFYVQGSSAFPSMQIEVLPDGTEAYNIYQVDQWGNQTNVISTYSENGSVLRRTNSYVYAANGVDLLQTIGPDGATTSYGYDSIGLHLVLFMTNAVGDVTSYTYNTNAQVTSVTQPTGLVTTNIYDTNGFLITTYNYAGSTYYGTNTYTYTNGLVYTHTDERGLTTTNTWDVLMRLTHIAYPDGTGTSYTYSNLDLVQVVDRMGYTISYGYNNIRQLIAGTNALGYHTFYGYCLCGGLDSVQNALGDTTTFSYDFAGRKINASYPDGYGITNFFSSIGQITNTIDGNGISTSYYFNNQGLLFAVSNTYGLVKHLVYDVNDRVTNQIDANGVITSMTYDILGRMLSRTYPDGGIERFGYSAFGLVAYTNQLANATYYAYDAARRKIAETNANNQVTQYSYDAARDLIALIDQKSNTTRWGYDVYGRVTNKVDATTNTILTYGYDPDNRLTNRWSIQKGTTTYGYDNVGNLTSVQYPVNGNLSFSYNAMNWMTMMSDGIGTTTFNYTPAGQLASEIGPWASDTIAYTYSDRLRTAMSLEQPNASAWIQNYGYDSANRLEAITSPAGPFTYTYCPGLAGTASSSSLVANIALPNGAFITNTYDNNGRMTGTTLENSSSTALDSSQYTYNVGNQRITVQRGENNAAYTYDPIGQVTSDLASESVSPFAPRLNERLKYQYDPAGNLIYRTNNALVQDFQVNSLNELTTNTNGGTLTVVGTTTSAATNVTVNGSLAQRYNDATFAATNLPLTTAYTAVAQDSYGRIASNTATVNIAASTTFQYDANGNLTNDGLRSFAYDDENQLIQVWVTNQWMSQFTYDGKMRRRIRQEFTWNGSGWTQTNGVYYVYDGNLVIQERDINNLPTRTYTRGKDLSGSLQGAGGIGGLLARSSQQYADGPLNGLSFYHADCNGNITMLINSSQAVLAKYLYDAFGNVLSKSGLLADANAYQFSSKEKDLNSGLVYYLYRFYDPNLQRWLNRDPIYEHGGINLYVFVENQPTVGRDPLGLDLDGEVRCAEARVAAELALQHAASDPTTQNVQAAQAAVAAAYAACGEKPPRPPSPPACPPPPVNPFGCWPKSLPGTGSVGGAAGTVMQYQACLSCCALNFGSSPAPGNGPDLFKACTDYCAYKAGTVGSGGAGPPNIPQWPPPADPTKP